MKILTEEEAKTRLESKDNLAQVIPYKHKGKPTGSIVLPAFLREKIAIAAQNPDKTNKELSEEFGVGVRAVSSARIGSNGHRSLPELTSKISAVKESLQEKAIEKMMMAFGLMTDDKMGKTSAKDLSNIVSNMAKTIRDTSSQEKQGPQVQVLIYAPELRAEEKYETIEA